MLWHNRLDPVPGQSVEVLKGFLAGPYLVDLADGAHAIAFAGLNLSRANRKAHYLKQMLM
jgi:hypothetical protein